MKKIIIITTLIFLAANATAIFDDYEPSARARAMGGAFYSISDDASAVFYNPAGLYRTTNNIMIGYAKLFNNDFQVINSVALSMKLPRKFGTLGIGLLSMDVDFQDVSLLSEKTYAVSHSFNILEDIHSTLDIGYTLNMYHLSIDGFGDQPAFGVNLGVLASVHQRTQVGFTFSNLNNPSVGEENQYDLPQKMSMGISYHPYTDVITSLEFKKTMNSKTEIHAGTEVKVADMLYLRCGVRSEPTSYSMGARFDMFNMIVDYGFNTHTIDPTHHFSIGYKF